MSTISIDINREWELEHFLTFILLYVASSDLSIDEEEISEMEVAVKKYTPVQDFLKVYNDAYDVFKFLTTDERTALITKNKSTFVSDDESMAMILTCVEEVIMADLSVEDEEAHTYTALKRILRS